MPQTGDTLRFSADLYDKPVEDGGVLVNASTVVLTITRPDGTTIVPVVTNPPAMTGEYFHDHVTAPTGPAGRYQGSWLFTLASGQTVASVETFDVALPLVTVDEAVAHLRAAGVITSADDIEQLEWLCAVATDAVERDLQIVVAPRSVTETYNGGDSEIFLHCTPVISVTSVLEFGSLLAAADYFVDAVAGVVYRGTTAGLGRFSAGRQNIQVTYTCGYPDPPRVLRKVALNAVQAMWQQSQQAGHELADDVSGDEAVFGAAGSLTPVEKAGYDSLRAAGVA